MERLKQAMAQLNRIPVSDYAACEAKVIAMRLIAEYMMAQDEKKEEEKEE